MDTGSAFTDGDFQRGVGMCAMTGVDVAVAAGQFTLRRVDVDAVRVLLNLTFG